MSDELPALQRHQLVRLRADAWADRAGLVSMANGIRQPEWARLGLAHWAEHQLPLVVARQRDDAAPDTVTLGLPLPACWGRQRLAFTLPLSMVASLHAFPAAASVDHLLSEQARPAWRRLCHALQALGLQPQVFGSYGWQALTGLGYLRAGSDLDLLLPVASAEQADTAATVLSEHGAGLPRLDGELLFDQGTAVAWREWQAWRSGQSRQILLKQVQGLRLVADDAWLAAA